LEALGAKVAVVSTDDVASVAAFAKAQEATFRFLSDPDGGVARKYDVLLPERGFAKRVTFLVDPEGVVRSVDGGVKVDSHGKDIVEELKRLRAPAAAPGDGK
jgi:peroxiredoxin Q/BCP